MSDQAVVQKVHPFFQIYNTVIDHYGLNPYELSLYTVLVRHANYATGLAFPSYSRLMELTSTARATMAWPMLSSSISVMRTMARTFS